MLLDKDFVFDFAAANMQPTAPVHQVAASYETTNVEEDVIRIRELLAEAGIEENFWFFTSCSKRIYDACGEVNIAGAAAALAATINGVNLIAFDMFMINFTMENGMTFAELMEHELIHLEQLESGRLSMTANGIEWVDEDGKITVYDLSATRITDPMNFERSLTFQLALPWEAEAYAPEVSRGGTTPRAYALRVAAEMAQAAHDALLAQSRAVIDLIRWTELAMSLMIFKYKDYETADEQLGYMDLDSNIHVRTNQMRDVVKSLMSQHDTEFQEYCRRSC